MTSGEAAAALPKDSSRRNPYPSYLTITLAIFDAAETLPAASDAVT